MSSINYEEEDAIVVDSEEEREGVLSLASLPMQAPSKQSTIETAETTASMAPRPASPFEASISSISTFGLPTTKQTNTSISSFSTEASMAVTSATGPRVRPRPRPAYKSADNSNTTTTSSRIDFPDTPQPVVLATGASSSSVCLDEVEATSSSVLRDRISATHSRVTPSSKGPSSNSNSNDPSGIVDLVSDDSDDDLRLRPSKLDPQPTSTSPSIRQRTSSPQPPLAGPSSLLPSPFPAIKHKHVPDDSPKFFMSSSSSSLPVSSPLHNGLQQTKTSTKRKRKWTQISNERTLSLAPVTPPKDKKARARSEKSKSSKKSKAANKGDVTVTVEPLLTSEKVQYKSREFIDDSDEDVSVDQPVAEPVEEQTLSVENQEPVSVEVGRDEDEAGKTSERKKKKKKKSEKSSTNATKAVTVDLGFVNAAAGEDVTENPRSCDESLSAPKIKSTKRSRRILESDEEEAEQDLSSIQGPADDRGAHAREQPSIESGKNTKENRPPFEQLPTKPPPRLGPRARSLGSRPTPMSELIRRASLHASSLLPTGTSAYSPLLKSSRNLLARIAPLHMHRSTPPPPLPRAPLPKKSKRQLQLEEKWEEELSESVEGWSAMTDQKRAELRKAKWEMEMGECD